MRTIWVRKTGQYESGHRYVCGYWTVGASTYNSARNRDEPNKWRATTTLPGLKDELGHFATEEEAKAKVEQAVRYWISRLEEGL